MKSKLLGATAKLKLNIQSGAITSTELCSLQMDRQIDLSHGMQEVGGSIPPGSTILQVIFDIYFRALMGIWRGSKGLVTI